MAVNEAQQEATKALGAEEDDGDGSAGDDGQHELESAAKRARTAGNCVLQVRRKGCWNLRALVGGLAGGIRYVRTGLASFVLKGVDLGDFSALF